MAILDNGVDIKNKELVKRSEIVAFAGGDATFYELIISPFVFAIISNIT